MHQNKEIFVVGGGRGERVPAPVPAPPLDPSMPYMNSITSCQPATALLLPLNVAPIINGINDKLNRFIGYEKNYCRFSKLILLYCLCKVSTITDITTNSFMRISVN